MPATPALVLSPEVGSALSENRPVVALESTLIAHGMPFPDNVTTAMSLEKFIRDEGAIPATIAVMDGAIRVGLDDAQLQQLATDKDVLKASRRDLAWLLTKKASGATTVASTMLAARMVGIRVFATGGIGGVHRGAGQSFDISADLEELGRSEVAVVSAGAKSILDLAATLEYLETQGVPVIGYRSDDFPAFYARSSGLKAPLRLDSPEEIADLMRAHWGLGLRGGILIANPIPESAAMEAGTIEAAIQTAVDEAGAAGIGGKELTPFLLRCIKNLTGGASLIANIRLVENNARLAAKIAVAYVAGA